jgi:magnesium transporter
MLTTYPTPGREDATASKVYWIDLLRPTEDKRTHVEHNYHLQLPTREELSEVELPSRVSEENGVLFLNMPTVTYMSGIDRPPSPLGFVLSKDILVTIRYTELRAFESVVKKCAKDGAQLTSLETACSPVPRLDLTGFPV